MPTPILMPALSPTMEEGTLAKWHVKEGDQVSAGDVIAEIETDKATMEVEAVDEGIVGKILVDEGTEHVPVNKPIAVLLGEGESADALEAFATAGPTASTPQEAEPAAAAASAQVEAERRHAGLHEQPEAKDGVPPREDGAHGQAAQAAPQVDVTVAAREASAAGSSARANGQVGRILASPLARRLARESGIDLSRLRGSGPHGRIIKRDIEKARKEGIPAAAAAPAEAAAAPSRGEVMTRGPAPGALPQAMTDEQILSLYEPNSYEIVPHDNMRRIIATRLTQAKLTIPHFYLNIDCEIDALLAARERINALSPKEGPGAFKVSVNDMIIKALAMALQKVPAANATWTERGILRHRSSDIGVAVAVPNGLFTPVIRHAEVKSLSEIANEMRDLAARARARRLAPHEYQGGTTAISNLGMYGVKSFDAVINPPHSSILAVGQGEKRPVVKNDQLTVATMMSCTLSCDHRVIDGALGAELLAAFKRFIEEPVTMLV